MKTKNRAGKIILTVVVLVFGVCSIYPFLFMLFSSFKPSGEVLTTPFTPITANFTLTNFLSLTDNTLYNFGQWYGNTIVMTVTTLVFKMIIVTITAYGFSKIRFPGRNGIFLILLAALMIPADIMIMPRYMIFKSLKILNTMWSIVIPSTIDVYFVFLLRQAFIAIPDSISEAATIDGCGHLQIYARFILPLSKPAISTMMLFSFVWVWNDYMSPYLYISDVKKQMLSVGIKLFSGGQIQDYGAQMAGATVVLIPIIAVFFLCQKYFIEGVTAGAVKG